MPVRRSIFIAAAFAALFVISGAAGWAVWTNTRRAQEEASALHRHDTEVREALVDVQTNVYMTAILARDFLLDSDVTDDDYVGQFASMRTRIASNLGVLRQSLTDPESQTTLARLTAEVDEYNAITEELFRLNPLRSTADRDEVLRRRTGRRRDILSLTERLASLAAQSSGNEEALLAEADESFRSSLGYIAGMTLLLGLGVALLTLVRMRGLEQQSESAQTELRSLSGQLRTAQEQERKYLSRELHDQVGQMLTGLRMELTAVSRTTTDRDLLVTLDRAKSTVEQTLGIVRNIAMLLRPSMLDDLGLTPALTWLVREVSRSSGIEIKREIDDRVDQLPDAHRTCLYRVVQEALTNISRHSGARHAELRVTVTSGWVRVLVKDDGRGFEVAAQKKRGLGLVGMEERVRELGGNLHVTSIPGRGTLVEIRLPQPATMEAGNDQSDDLRRSRDRADGVKTSI